MRGIGVMRGSGVGNLGVRLLGKVWGMGMVAWADHMGPAGRGPLDPRGPPSRGDM